MRLARLALQWPYPGGKQVVLDLVAAAVAGDLGMAMELAYLYLANVRRERTLAEAAVEFLERWARGASAGYQPADYDDCPGGGSPGGDGGSAAQLGAQRAAHRPTRPSKPATAYTGHARLGGCAWCVCCGRAATA